MAVDRKLGALAPSQIEPAEFVLIEVVISRARANRGAQIRFSAKLN